MSHMRLPLVVLAVVVAGLAPGLYPQAKRAAGKAPQIDVDNYAIQASLNPDAHEIKATATITFKPLENTDFVVFELSENLSIQKVTNEQGVELEFGQDESGPGIVSIRFPQALSSGTATTVRVEYTGGFDQDRYSRFYARDQSSAYIGMEGTYLLYSAKWFPVSRFLVDRATA